MRLNEKKITEHICYNVCHSLCSGHKHVRIMGKCNEDMSRLCVYETRK